MMNKINLLLLLRTAIIVTIVTSCAPSKIDTTLSDQLRQHSLPETFIGQNAIELGETQKWRTIFDDSQLNTLIETALEKNQELNILLQEINIAQNEANAIRGEYLPRGDFQIGAGGDRAGEFTRDGAVEENLEVSPGQEFRSFVGDFSTNIRISWEIDIWKKLRNAQKAQVLRYLATREGRTFMTIRLVSEITSAYYEIQALSARLSILKNMIEIQSGALEATRLLKQGAKVSELAVQKFEAEVFKNQSEIFIVEQEIIEAENRLRFLVGDFDIKIERSTDKFNNFQVVSLNVGVPADLVKNRPDIRQAEFEISATDLDIEVARSRFYPKIDLNAAFGIESVSLGTLTQLPESLLYGVAADITTPIFNRAGIRAAYRNANAQQLQTLYGYQRTIIKAYIEVSNLLSNAANLHKSLDLKMAQVNRLTASVESASTLFNSARADYLEVLLTQRDALEAELELLSIKEEQIDNLIETFQAIGGVELPIEMPLD